MNILADGHTHTLASGHAYSTLDENARYAAQKGIAVLGMTDHAPAMKNTTSHAYFTNFHSLPSELHGVKLLRGVELNILDFNGAVDLDQELIKGMDISIASLHPPCIESGSCAENTRALIKAMENPFIDILGHPGDPRFPIDVKAVFLAARDSKTLLELNNQSLIPNGFRKGSDVILRQLMKLAMEHGTPIVLGSDAHFYTQIGDVSYCEEMLLELQFPESLVLNTSAEGYLHALKHSNYNTIF